METSTKEKTIVPNWQVTATLIYCDAVEADVTVMVHKDWSTSCGYYKRWGPVRREKKKGIEAVLHRLGIVDEIKCIPASDCGGPEKCPKLLEYRDKLYQEEEVARGAQPA